MEKLTADNWQPLGMMAVSVPGYTCHQRVMVVVEINAVCEKFLAVAT
jgi:hypothetical protein